MAEPTYQNLLSIATIEHTVKAKSDGTEYEIMDAPPSPGSSVPITHFSTFKKNVQSPAVNGTPKIDNYAVKFHNRGQRCPYAKEILVLSIKAVFTNHSGGSAERGWQSVEFIVESAVPNTISSDGDHVPLFDVALVPIPNADNPDITGGTQ